MTITNDIVLAIDLGGTNMRMAAVGRDGQIFSHAKTETKNANDPQKLLAAFCSLADECRAAIATDHRLVAIGAGVPANKTDGPLSSLPNLPGIEGMDLKRELTDRFNVPVAMENDATAAAIGESWLGASKDVRDSLMITLGTGIGGGIIINKEPFRGIDGVAGKLGHICVEPDGVPCKCGSRGCIEEYASATAIVRMANEAGLKVTTSFEVYQLAKGLSEPGAIATGPDAEKAKAVFKKMARYLGITLAGLVNALNSEMIVIGGGAAAAFDIFIDDLTTELNYRAFKEPAARVKIVRGILADNAGLLGAARSAYELAEKSQI